MRKSTTTTIRLKCSRLVREARKGAIAPLSAVLLTATFAFVAFAVDTGIIVTAQTNAQNAADAAALAASLEIVAAIHHAGQDQDDIVLDADSIAVAQARLIAQQVAQANGASIDPNLHVTFGRRAYASSTNSWPITWNSPPYNVVRVDVRRDNDDVSASNGKVPLTFGWAVGQNSAAVVASATAFLESRDIVITLDFSGSMNDDSTIAAFSKLGQTNVQTNLDQIWSALVASNQKFAGSTKVKFPSTGFGNINSAYGTSVSSTTADTVFNTLNLGATDSAGKLKFPFPQAGKDSSGNQYGIPSASTSKSRWIAYINYVMNHSNTTYKKRYGYRTLIDYLLVQKSLNSQSEDLWRTPHYPFQSLKDATSLFCDFLEELDFDDECGLTSYATTAKVETGTYEDGANVSLGSNLITSDRPAIKMIQQQRQAGHWSNTTNIGDGIKKGRTLIATDGRFGARKTILLVTDGLANERPSGWTLPTGWKWSDWTDFNGDGYADYTNSDVNCQYAFWEATEAIKQGVTIHAVTVGIDADDDLMEAIAKASGGIWIDVPGGSTVAAMEEQMRSAFSQIASRVPPPKLVAAP